jgi:hypothetical protein
MGFWTVSSRISPRNLEGITAGSISAWFVLALRLVIGFAFLYSGE